MKKLVLFVAFASAFGAGVALAQPISSDGGTPVWRGSVCYNSREYNCYDVPAPDGTTSIKCYLTGNKC